MAKSTGLGDRLFLDGYDLSGDIGSVDTIACPIETLDVQGIDAGAYERLSGKRDGQVEFVSYFNVAAGQAHPVLSALPLTDRTACYLNGTVVGNPAAGIVAKQLNYDGSRGDDGSFTQKTALSANGYGLNWCEQLTTGKQTFAASPGTGTSYDYGVAIGTTAFGLQAFLHVFSVAGTSATVAIQHSNDNGGADAWADINADATFAAATPAGSPQVQRIQTASNRSVKRWLRINATGVFTNLVCSVIVCKNLQTVLW